MRRCSAGDNARSTSRRHEGNEGGGTAGARGRVSTRGTRIDVVDASKVANGPPMVGWSRSISAAAAACFIASNSIQGARGAQVNGSVDGSSRSR